jgi:Transposase zinc-ribbon domain/ISXO2-like transposase domain
MAQQNHNDLWRDFPKTAQEFEARFATEEDCRAYWIQARWGGHPACARCNSTRVWTERDGFLFECAECSHQTSLTSGTLLEKTRKPFKTWFRAVFEISTRRTGISGKDLQRILGFGSYKTAWSWLHKLRAAMVRSDSEPLGPFVQLDEALVGGKGGPHKELVLVAAEANGRVRLAHVENNDKDTCKRFAEGQIAADTHVVTDGHAGYSEKSLGKRPRHDRADQGGAPRKRRGPELPLDDLTLEALAARNARWRGARQAPAGLPRRVRLPPQPPQDQWRGTDRGPRNREPRRATTADDAKPDRRNAAMPLVGIKSGRAGLS